MDTYFKTLHRDDQSAAGGEPAAIIVDPDQRQLTLRCPEISGGWDSWGVFGQTELPYLYIFIQFNLIFVIQLYRKVPNVLAVEIDLVQIKTLSCVAISNCCLVFMHWSFRKEGASKQAMGDEEIVRRMEGSRPQILTNLTSNHLPVMTLSDVRHSTKCSQWWQT